MRTGMARPSQKSAAAAPAMAVPATTRAARFFLAVLQFACPLLFFTNLTRNPYFTQIALLFIGIALCGVAWAVETFRRGEWRIPRLPFETPLLAFLAAAMICSLVSFGVHALLRPGLAFEMTRVWIFTIVNCVLALYLPLVFTTPLGGDGQPHRAITSDLVMAILWGAGWVAFAQMKTNDPSQTIWDPYGGFLWAIGLLYAIARTRHGDARSIFHVVFVVSFLAGAYGILQYAGHDIIWTSPVQPYGGRPVSTFGNPNFLSSYLMLACPLAIAFALRAQKAQRWGYAVVALVSGLGILSTLTRSTYVGLAAALLAMGAALFRREDLRFVKIATVALVAFVAFILLFPSTPVTHVQSPLARFTEIFEAMKTGQSYGPWHQRLLIWSSAWEMQKGFQLVGRGWGTFELFYPFFQGKFLLIPQLAQWRTHANNAHNVLLEFWSQTGLLGTGAS
ncbi:MAG: O-antigen ligase family protein, partial [Elusimicrobia bacterium]|nr:O-antigen ligase family protein [Elusimicrobiota bacterium]